MSGCTFRLPTAETSHDNAEAMTRTTIRSHTDSIAPGIFWDAYYQNLWESAWNTGCRTRRGCYAFPCLIHSWFTKILLHACLPHLHANLYSPFFTVRLLMHAHSFMYIYVSECGYSMCVNHYFKKAQILCCWTTGMSTVCSYPCWSVYIRTHACIQACLCM